MNLATIAEKITHDSGIYSGGPIRDFERVGRNTFITALMCGLLPEHKLLDFGCGSLRLGYWFVRFLERNCYCGIEPVKTGLEAGKRYALGEELIAAKNPRFSLNSNCDMSVFGDKFDLVIARSIFSHMGPGLVRTSLTSFRENSRPSAVMLASYWQAIGEHTYKEPDDVTAFIGDDLKPTDMAWTKVMKYSFPAMQAIAVDCGLKVSEFKPLPLINQQVWLRFTK
jgi:hypothetical protein